MKWRPVASWLFHYLLVFAHYSHLLLGFFRWIRSIRVVSRWANSSSFLKWFSLLWSEMVSQFTGKLILVWSSQLGTCWHLLPSQLCCSLEDLRFFDILSSTSFEPNLWYPRLLRFSRFRLVSSRNGGSIFRLLVRCCRGVGPVRSVGART